MTGTELTSVTTFEAGTFHAVGHGHALTRIDLEPGPLFVGSKYNLVSMFEVWDLERDGKHVGYYFQSGFRVECQSMLIVTYMESKRGKATKHDLVLRCDDFVLFSFEGCGAMAISSHVGADMKQFLGSQ